MHVLWLDLVVALPAAALLLLFLAGRRAGLPLRLVALAACLLAPVGAYASLIEPERLQLERAELTVQKRLESAAGLGDVRLLVAHRPDTVLNLRPRTRIDLTLAGHTHGGQVQLPGVGPLMIASRVPRSVGAAACTRSPGGEST